MSSLIGYARVSKSDGSQDASLQTDALAKAGVEKMFVDRASGAKGHRPQLDAMLDYARPGDTIVCWRLDRLGRSLSNLIALADRLASQDIALRSLSESLDTSTANGRMFFSIMATLAQFERDLISERTRAGLDAARARGRSGGRPPALTPAQVTAARAMYSSGDLTVPDIATALGVSTATVYRNVRVPA
jgi:DNA invertase Pin-like site-specific DNA recombinase